MNSRIAATMLAVAGMVLAGCSGQQSEPVRVRPAPTPERSRSQTASANAANEFSGSLRPLNGSGVRGEVLITVDDGEFVVRITARGMAASQQHGVGVHGFRDGRLAQGPTVPEPVSSVGLRRSVGPQLVALEPIRAGTGGVASGYRARAAGDDAYPLDIRAIVIRGPARRGARRGEPVAYALLRPAELGDGGTGGPGAAPSGQAAGGGGSPGLSDATGGDAAGATGGSIAPGDGSATDAGSGSEADSGADAGSAP